MMKQQIILILFLLGNVSTSFSAPNAPISTTKKTAFDELIGSYDGFTITQEGVDNSNKAIAELTSDFNLKVTEIFDGLLVEHINEKIAPQAAGATKDGYYIFEFKAASEESEFKLIRISIYTESLFPNTNYSMSIAMAKKSDELSVFAVKKEGGNPKMPDKNIDFSDIYEAVSYTGKTSDNTFGDYKIEWFPSQGIGFLRYKNLSNVFKVTKKGNKYRVVHNNGKEDIDLEYQFPNSGKMKLLKIHKGNPLFDQAEVKPYKSLKPISNEKEFLIEVGHSFYSMIYERYKVKGEYSFTHDNKSNGHGIKIIVGDKKAIVYAGGFKDGIYHGEGAHTTLTGKNRGSFQNGKRQGHFYSRMLGGYQASGEYIDGIQEGLWKVKFSNNATADIVFKNGKEVSRTNTNKGVKNTQIAKHVDDAQYQLKSAKRLMTEMVAIADACDGRTTLKSYQSCLRTLKPKIDAFSVGIVAADRELTKAIKEAEKSKCEQTLQILKNAEEYLWEANGKFGEAYKAVTELYHTRTTSVAKAEHKKCFTALKKAAESFNEYNIWIAALITNTCYQYSITDKSTLPSRFSSKSRISSERRASLDAYEGDNLLLLMGQKMNAPAVQEILKDPTYDFQGTSQSSAGGERNFFASKQKFTITFKNGIITQFSFLYQAPDINNYFKKKLPLDIPLAKQQALIFNLQDSWNLDKAGSNYIWSLKKHQLLFEAIGDIEKSIVEKVIIKANGITDWNRYYKQFQ